MGCVIKREAVNLTRESIEQYLIQLLPELNLRLFLDMYGEETEEGRVMEEPLYPERFLWIEEISVTSYEPCCTKWRIFNCIKGKWADKLPFVHNKYKKERR